VYTRLRDMFFRLGDKLKRLVGAGNDRYRGFTGPKNAEKRIIGIKPTIHGLLESYSPSLGPSIRLTAEHLIRLGIATEQKLAILKLLGQTPPDLLPVRSHRLPRKYIAINRQLYFLVRQYADRHRMTTKYAAEHLICLGLVAKYGLEYLGRNRDGQDGE
jgi:hypothetical protein